MLINIKILKIFSRILAVIKLVNIEKLDTIQKKYQSKLDQYENRCVEFERGAGENGSLYRHSNA